MCVFEPRCNVEDMERTTFCIKYFYKDVPYLLINIKLIYKLRTYLLEDFIFQISPFSDILQ